MSDPRQIDSELVQEVFTDTFRSMVGARKPWSIDALAEATGIHSRTLRAYQVGDCLPTLPKLLKIATALGDSGPAFLSSCLASAGFGGVERITRTAFDLPETQAQIAELLAEMAAALRDLKVTPQEKAKLRPRMLVLSRWLEEQARAE